MDTIYFIGSLAVLKQLFPSHDFSHVRTSLDGVNAVIEEQPTDDMQKDLIAQKVQCLSHDDAVAYLNDPKQSGVWYAPESEVAQ